MTGTLQAISVSSRDGVRKAESMLRHQALNERCRSRSVKGEQSRHVVVQRVCCSSSPLISLLALPIAWLCNADGCGKAKKKKKGRNAVVRRFMYQLLQLHTEGEGELFRFTSYSTSRVR